MSDTTWSVSEAVQRLSRRDPTLTYIYLFDNNHTDAQLAELADCLLAHPDVVKRVGLGGNQLTDKTSAKLARYLAASSTLQEPGSLCLLYLPYNEAVGANRIAVGPQHRRGIRRRVG